MSLIKPITLLALALVMGCVFGKGTVRESPAGLRDPARMVKMPGGKFQMGYDHADNDEFPAHEVELDPFLIDRSEVNNADYGACVRAASCQASPYADHEVLGRARHPVVGIPFRQARRYCDWVEKRLPTEAEWEYAARAPTFSFYPWAAPFEPTRANGRGKVDGYEQTSETGAFPTGNTPLGVEDMAGNASEWTADWFDATYYQRSETRNPKGPSSTGYRSVRGGSWADPPHRLRNTARGSADPNRGKIRSDFVVCAGSSEPRLA